jgi:hypothetical protein
VIEGDLVESEIVYVTASPTRASTLPPTTARDSAVMQMIESSALQRSAQFSTMSADDPRVLALDWILHDDELQLEANHPGLIQRYTLALLAFQFDHLTWHYDVANLTSDGTLDWLSSTHECEWYGISCHDTKVTEIDLCKCQFEMHAQKVSFGNLHWFWFILTQ